MEATRDPLESEPQLPASAADPPPQQCICCGVSGTRCINVALPSRGGPYHDGRWCAECRPVDGEEKCGCLCGGCEVHDYGSVLPRIYARTPHDALRPSSVTSPLATVSSVQPWRAATHPWLRPPLEADPRSRPRPDAVARSPAIIAAVIQHEHVARSARHRGSVPTRLDLAVVIDRSLATTRRRPHPPPPGIILMRTPDAYVATSRLNRNATAKQRGRRGFRDPIVDAGWGLFLTRDMIRNDVVVDYRFVDGREGTEVDRLNADQLRERYPDPLQPPTHVLQAWGSSSYWDALPCKGIGGFANSRINQQNCLFRGYKICIGKMGQRADSEVFVSYSSSKSYQWARDLTTGEDFYAQRSVPPSPAAPPRPPPWSSYPWAASLLLRTQARRALPEQPSEPSTLLLSQCLPTPSLRSIPEPSMRLRLGALSDRTRPLGKLGKRANGVISRKAPRRGRSASARASAVAKPTLPSLAEEVENTRA